MTRKYHKLDKCMSVSLDLDQKFYDYMFEKYFGA